MKRFISKICLAFCFCVIFYLVFLLLWGKFASRHLQKNVWPYETESYHLKFDDLKKIDSDLDILFIGSSHCAGGFDPRIFREYGYAHTFNLGTGGQTPVNTETLLNEYLEKLNPNMVVIETYPQPFSRDGDESFVKLIVNSAYCGEIPEVAMSHNKLIVFNSLLFKYMHNWVFHRPNFFYEPAETGKYIEDGYFETKDLLKRKYSFKKQKWEFKDFQKQAFERIIKRLRENNIDYILVQAPLTKMMYNSYTNNDEIDQYFASQGEYLNFNKLIELDDNQHFWDTNHINQSGVELFNKALLKYLSERKNRR